MPFNPAPSLTAGNARNMLAQGMQAISDGQRLFDFSGLLSVDSTAVAVLLAWQRDARTKSVTLSFVNVPDTLQNLTALYDVATLLPNQLDVSSFLAKTAASPDNAAEPSPDQRVP